MGADPWNPDLYDRFRDERRQPFWDLVALVRPRPGMRVADLGCGTGELTRELHRRLEARETTGIDASDAMLARSGEFAGDGVRFVKTDIATWQPGPVFDLVFSNAALHWLPDHERLLVSLRDALAPAGQLAVQVPANHDHPSFAVAAEVAQESPFEEALSGFVQRDPVAVPEQYARWLFRLGFREQIVRLHVYDHRLASRDEVVEFMKGAPLTDYERRLGPALFERYLSRYREKVLPRLEDSRPFLFPFKRILFWATL